MPQFYSDDIKATKLSELRKIFPEVFSDGKVDWEMLQTALGESVEGEKEHYRFEWSGKRECYRTIQTPSDATLKVDEENSIDFDTSENVIIEGDNLEVLKLLQKSYRGKVKMIYIDPPYNKAKDFVYSDSWSEPIQNYLLQTEQGDNEGYLSTRTETAGRRHTNWLNMIYPRLYLARNLLKDDGVIFISIDDDEVHNLRKIMDEIYGEENFVAQFVWKSRQNKDNRNTSGVSIDHEYILCYIKNENFRALKGSERKIDQYKNLDNDPRGKWTSGNMVGLLSEELRPNCHYDLVDPATEINYGKPKMGWRYDKNTMSKLIKDNRILWPTSPDGRPRRKVFLNELSDDLAGFSSVVGESIYTRNGSKEIEELLNEKHFDFPKPSSLIKEFISQTTLEDDIVLDFFSGSGTTAHAVMAQNKDDNGDRKYILVQLPEPTPERSSARSAGYKNIAQITRERVKRAKEKLGYEEGFRAFTLSSSNYKAIGIKKRESDESMERILERLRMSMFADNTLVGNYKELDVVFEYAIKNGFTLASSVTSETCGSYSFYKLSDEERTVWFSFDEKVGMDMAECIAKGEKLVLLDGALDDSTKLNLGFERGIETI